MIKIKNQNFNTFWKPITFLLNCILPVFIGQMLKILNLKNQMKKTNLNAIEPKHWLMSTRLVMMWPPPTSPNLASLHHLHFTLRHYGRVESSAEMLYYFVPLCPC